MTEAAIIAIAIVSGLVLLAIILLGRSIKIDTKHLKAEIGRNGGTTAIDMLHKRFDEIHDHVDVLAMQLSKLDRRIGFLEDPLDAEEPAA